MFNVIYVLFVILQNCRVCNVHVWEQPWEDKKNTSKINCDESYKINTNHEVVNVVS